MESFITNEALAPYNIFDKVRVVRGTKLIDLGQAVSRINSSVQKKRLILLRFILT